MKVKVGLEITVDVENFESKTDEEKNIIIERLVDTMINQAYYHKETKMENEYSWEWIDEEEPNFNEDILIDV